jgi:hypothetical protein
MDEKYERGILRISGVFILAAALLIPLGFVGVGASIVVVGAMVALSAGLYVAWQNSEEYSMYLSGLWLGPVIAAIVTLVGIVIGASPGELQALGGVTGLIGVINLLMRPIYRFAYWFLGGAIQIGREMREEGW